MPVPLIATYRLQLNADFTLHDARARVPYLRALGVSHLYCSPVLAARGGSTHGYDVADPTHISAALGGEDALVALADTAHAHDMGILLDIVPNHMGVGADNPYWDDVLAHGRASRYASWFDVAWRAPTKRLADKVLVPVLGDTLEKVLLRDEIRLDASDTGVRVRYVDHHFPLDPASLPPELEVAQRDPGAREMLDGWMAGEHGRARLRALLAAQHYELAFWRAAQRDINYRRFFDINDLICLRVEEPEVFDATHHTVLRLVADGMVDGLRVDHVDGLLEPRRYLERLRAAVDARRPVRKGEPRFPIFVEKILASGESLPHSWPVEGTTGYEFLVTAEDVFIDPTGHALLESRYRRAGDAGFHSVAVASKRRVLRSTLNADVRRIAPMLASVARRAGWPERPIAAYAKAIVELVAALPVYRTYLDAERPDADARDRALLSASLASARAKKSVDPEATNALEHALLGEWRTAEAELARKRLAFVLRWQQLTGPAAAKGVEDTALYAYAPLTSRNEVGGDPGAPVEGAIARLHGRLHERALRFPRSLNATNTHDTKRSADARARLDALSEHAADWGRALRRWRRWNGERRALVKGRMVPTRAADDFIYQALVAVWPLAAEHQDGDDWLSRLRERLAGYVLKAMREAKASTSWTDPDAEYEEGIDRYLGTLLDPSESAPFLADVQRFVDTIAPQGMWNALGRLVVHCCAPGVHDIYQGDELWFAALVDPDNRRPVDWPERERVLRAADSVAALDCRAAALREWRDAMHASELKMFVTRELLALRRAHCELFEQGGYEPLEATGQHRSKVVAFRRRGAKGEQAIVLMGRCVASLGASPAGDAWEGTWLPLGDDAPAHWRCVIHGAPIAVAQQRIRVGDAFSILPVSVLLPGEKVV